MDDAQFQKQKAFMLQLSPGQVIEAFDQFEDKLRDLNQATWLYRKLYCVANAAVERLKTGSIDAARDIVNADAFTGLCPDCTFQKCFGDKCPEFADEKVSRLKMLLNGLPSNSPRIESADKSMGERSNSHPHRGDEKGDVKARGTMMGECPDHGARAMHRRKISDEKDEPIFEVHDPDCQCGRCKDARAKEGERDAS